MKFILLQATIRPIYKCIKCGFQKAGTNKIEVDSAGQLDKLQRVSPAAQGIPVGWCANGGGNYRCQDCF